MQNAGALVNRLGEPDRHSWGVEPRRTTWRWPAHPSTEPLTASRTSRKKNTCGAFVGAETSPNFAQVTRRHSAPPGANITSTTNPATARSISRALRRRHGQKNTEPVIDPRWIQAGSSCPLLLRVSEVGSKVRELEASDSSLVAHLSCRSSSQRSTPRSAGFMSRGLGAIER